MPTLCKLLQNGTECDNFENEQIDQIKFNYQYCITIT